ncbi:MAG: hypothetical protein HQ579_01435 [Candidatus Omnitrophica bacterium]|nr:hypothetical protein [Candidatus Omnitrophota bacterium]
MLLTKKLLIILPKKPSGNLAMMLGKKLHTAHNRKMKGSFANVLLSTCDFFLKKKNKKTQ